MGILHNIRMRRRGLLLQCHGMGPFTPTSVQAFISGRCEQCGDRIPEITLLGNALTVMPKQIVVLCVSCRGSSCVFHNNHAFRVDRVDSKPLRTVDRDVLLGEIATLANRSGCRFDYYDFLLCLRHGFGLFQSYGRNPYAGFSESVAAHAVRRFGRLLPGSCAECGALWANDWEMQRDLDAILQYRGVNKLYCPACKLPNKCQWFMRAGAMTERHKLGLSGSGYAVSLMRP
jgi:hypothetical protein